MFIYCIVRYENEKIKSEIHMNSITERRRRERDSLLQSSYSQNDTTTEQISYGNTVTARMTVAMVFLSIIMHKSHRNGLIGIGILISALALIFVVNLENGISSEDDFCVDLKGGFTCISKNTTPYRYYGTKTSYKTVLQHQPIPDINVTEDCVPEVFYLLSRHATRYPDKKYIFDMMEILPSLQSRIINSSLNGKVQICDEDLRLLSEWRMTIQVEDDNKVSQTGAIEAEELAKRLKGKFPTLLDRPYSTDNFAFQYTSRIRTRNTADFFAKGLFGEAYKDVDLENKTLDDVLNFNKVCKKYMSGCDNSSYDLVEVNKFRNGSLMQKVVKSVSLRVGFNLTDLEVQTIYQACFAGYSLDISDIWCSLLSEDDLKVLEFNGDIDDYYKDAYGNQINYEQACPAAKFMTELFRLTKDPSSAPFSVFHFTHAGTFKKTLPLFGLFKDPLPLTADAFCEEQDRHWRSSLASPFLANLALVAYRCEGEQERRVLAMHNERQVAIRGCKDKLCTMQEFEEAYGVLAENCNLKEICCTCCK